MLRDTQRFRIPIPWSETNSVQFRSNVDCAAQTKDLIIVEVLMRLSETLGNLLFHSDGNFDFEYSTPVAQLSQVFTNITILEKLNLKIKRNIFSFFIKSISVLYLVFPTFIKL